MISSLNIEVSSGSPVGPEGYPPTPIGDAYASENGIDCIGELTLDGMGDISLRGIFFGVVGGVSDLDFPDVLSTSIMAWDALPAMPRSSIIFRGVLRFTDPDAVPVTVPPSVSMLGDVPAFEPPAGAAGFVNENDDALSSVITTSNGWSHVAQCSQSDYGP